MSDVRTLHRYNYMTFIKGDITQKITGVLSMSHTKLTISSYLLMIIKLLSSEFKKHKHRHSHTTSR